MFAHFIGSVRPSDLLPCKIQCNIHSFLEVFKEIEVMHKRRGNFRKIWEDTGEVSRCNEERELIPEDVDFGMDRFK